MSDLDDQDNPQEHRFRKTFEAELTGGVIPDNGVEGPRAIKAERIMNGPLMVAAALTLPSVALSEAHVGGPLEVIAQVLNWGIWIAFAVEFVVMLALVPDRGKYLRHHPVEIIVVFLTPPILPPGLQSLRAIRLLRLLRLLKLAQLSNRVFSNEGLQYAALLTLLAAVAGGSVFRAFEAGNQRLTEWEGVYWAFTAMTTLGSEYTATTLGGQITAVVVLLVGITFIAMLTGAIARRFLNPGTDQQ
ncbi:MAG: two pore domain potassium channel family protein [Solirubrobacterales bacterium]|nr:two pore domain potassium channel family protein [Solirubrobacterales bacterium]